MKFTTVCKSDVIGALWIFVSFTGLLFDNSPIVSQRKEKKVPHISVITD